MALPIQWSDVPRDAAPPQTVRQRIVGAGADLVRIEIPAGTNAARHAHDHEQFVQVIEGTGVLVTRDGERPFAAGSVFHFPAGTWHEARFDTPSVLVEVNLRT